jgi:hypothetical protein
MVGVRLGLGRLGVRRWPCSRASNGTTGGREHSVGLRVGLSGGEVSQRRRGLLRGPGGRGGSVVCGLRERAGAGRRRGAGYGRSAQPSRMPPDRWTRPERTARPCRDGRGVLGAPRRGRRRGCTIPLPGRLVVRPSIGMVGREAEMQSLADATKRVAGGDEREVLLIAGEAGIGKTTLVAEAGPGRLRPWGLRATGALRGGPGHPLPALRGGTEDTTSPMPRRTSS